MHLLSDLAFLLQVPLMFDKFLSEKKMKQRQNDFLKLHMNNNDEKVNLDPFDNFVYL